MITALILFYILPMVVIWLSIAYDRTGYNNDGYYLVSMIPVLNLIVVVVSIFVVTFDLDKRI